MPKFALDIPSFEKFSLFPQILILKLIIIVFMNLKRKKLNFWTQFTGKFSSAPFLSLQARPPRRVPFYWIPQDTKNVLGEKGQLRPENPLEYLSASRGRLRILSPSGHQIFQSRQKRIEPCLLFIIIKTRCLEIRTTMFLKLWSFLWTDRKLKLEAKLYNKILNLWVITELRCFLF